MQKFKFINNRYFTIILYRRLISPPLEFQLSAHNSKISQLIFISSPYYYFSILAWSTRNFSIYLGRKKGENRQIKKRWNVDQELIKLWISRKILAAEHCIVVNYSVENLGRRCRMNHWKLGCEVEDKCHYYKRRLIGFTGRAIHLDSKTGNIVQFA